MAKGATAKVRKEKFDAFQETYTMSRKIEALKEHGEPAIVDDFGLFPPLYCSSLFSPLIPLLDESLVRPRRKLWVDRIIDGPDMEPIRRESGGVAKKERSRRAKKVEEVTSSRLEHAPAAPSVPLAASVSYDIWGAAPAAVRLPAELAKTNRTFRLPETEGAAAAAVLPPSDGASVNPSFGEHQRALASAVNLAIHEDVAAQAIKEAGVPDRTMFVLPQGAIRLPSADELKAPVSASSPDELAQMAVHAAEAAEETARAKLAASRKVPGNLRRREARKAGHRSTDERHREAKRLAKEAARAEELALEVEAELAEKDARLAERHAHQRQKAPVLGKERFHPAEPTVHLTEDLSTTLRAVKPSEVSLLRDRMKALQSRNVIEARDRKKLVRKLKVKTKTLRRFK
jgi:hypothetical protein